MIDHLNFLRALGRVPDEIWYYHKKRFPQHNYYEQKQIISEQFLGRQAEAYPLHITSEIKIK